MRDDRDGGDLLCSGSYIAIPLWVRVLLYLGFEQVGSTKCLETLPPVLKSLLQSQALNQESLPFIFIPGKELWQAVALCIAGIQETVPGVLGYQADLLAHLNPDLSVWPPPAALECQAPFPQGTPILMLCSLVFAVGL